MRSYAKITDWFWILMDRAPWADYRFLPIFSYGFWVTVGFFAAATMATFELRRRQRLKFFQPVEIQELTGTGPLLGEAFFIFLISFFPALKIAGFVSYQTELSQGTIQLKDYMLSPMGSWPVAILVTAAALALYVRVKNKDRLPKPKNKKIQLYPADFMGEIVMVAFLLGVSGSILFDFLESPAKMNLLFQDPAAFLSSGLSIYGGFICAGFGFAAFAKYRKFHFGHFFDSVVPGVALANGFGRVGCQASGDGDWGLANAVAKPDWMPQFLWAQNYPHNIIDADAANLIPGCTEEHCHQLATAVYPTPIYEFLMCAFIALILWALRKKMQSRPGLLFFTFMILIGIQRYSIEQWRDLSGRIPYSFLGVELRQSEWISVVIVLVGAVFAARLLKRPAYE